MAQRNKLAVVSTAIVVSTLLLGMIGTSIGFLRSRAAQRQARANFEQARAAVSDMLAVADDDLYGLPGMQPLRVKLMRAAIDRYQPMLEQSSANPALRAELGRLYLKYGFAARDIGESYTNIVIPAYDAALAIQRQLVREQPNNQSLRGDLGWTIIYSYLWHNPSGFKTYQPEAIAIFESLVRENPGEPFARSGLAWALGLGEFGQIPDTPEKMARSQRRLALLEQLVKEYPRSAEFRRDLANQLGSYPGPGEVASDDMAKLARLSRANELRAEYLADLERHDPAALEPLHPRDSEARILRPSFVYAKFDLANGWRGQSQVLAQLKRWPEAISYADRATAISRGLLEENPSVKQFSALLNGCFSNRVRLAENSGNQTDARAHQLEADNFWRTHPSIERLDRFYHPAESEAVKITEIKEQSP